MSDALLGIAQVRGYEIPADVKEARAAKTRLDLLARRGLAPAPTPPDLLTLSEAQLDTALRDAALSRAAAVEAPGIARGWHDVADNAFHAAIGSAVPAWCDQLAADFRPVADAVIDAAAAFDLEQYVEDQLPPLSRAAVDLAEIAAQAEHFLAHRAEIAAHFGIGGHHPGTAR